MITFIEIVLEIKFFSNRFFNHFEIKLVMLPIRSTKEREREKIKIKYNFLFDDAKLHVTISFIQYVLVFGGFLFSVQMIHHHFLY